MSQLSEHDRDVIAEYPFNDSLHRARGELTRATDTSSTDAPSQQDTHGAVVNLIEDLTVHAAARELESRHGGTKLNLDLRAAGHRIQFSKNDFNYDHFRPLAKLVTAPTRVPDADIWEAVFSLLDTLAPKDPPESSPPSLPGTPIVRSSDTVRGSEQTRQKLESALFYEFQFCTFTKVEGYFEKYLDGKSWERKSNAVVRQVKRETKRRRKWYDSDKKRWTGIEDKPTQEKLWGWLFQFQAEFLPRSLNTFHGTMEAQNQDGKKLPQVENQKVEGGETTHQPDVFVKRRNAESFWEDVQVVGELKKSRDGYKGLLQQLMVYARFVFAAQPTRRFLHGFSIVGSDMRLWVFDRSGPYSSEKFNIHKDFEKFIKALTGYASMMDVELGSDIYIEKAGVDSFITVTTDAPVADTRIQLESSPFVKQRAVVCRGTTCFRTIDGRSVAKFAWRSDKRRPESELLQIARDKGVEGIAQFVGYKQLTTIEELRRTLIFKTPHKFDLPATSSPFAFSRYRSTHSTKRKHEGQEDGSYKSSKSTSQTSKPRPQGQLGESTVMSMSLYDTDGSKYSNRVFGCLVVSPAGRALCTFKSLKELVTALRDAIKAHHSLFTKANILHRDIAENNIIITDPDNPDSGGMSGMLIDLDLAKIQGQGQSGARQQTGTVQFMAIQVLQRKAHTYRHDLESFFYVLLWMCARRSWDMEFRCQKSKRPNDSILVKWYTGSFRDIAFMKQAHMQSRREGLEQILAEFPPKAMEPIKELCRQLRTILFPLDRYDEVLLGTYCKPDELYEKIIKEYDRALADPAIRGEP